MDIDIGMDSDIIKFILDYIQEIWLDEDTFYIYKNSILIDGVPSIVWNNLLHLDFIIINKFPNCDKEYIQNLSHFYLIAVSSYISNNKNYSIQDITLFTHKFLTLSNELYQIKVEYTI